MKRSRPAIKAEILAICQCDEGAKKTAIVYGANLNFRSVDSLLDELMDAGLLEPGNIGTSTRPEWRYRTTEKGVAAAGLLRASGLV